MKDLENNILKHYLIINEINIAITNAKTLHDALHNSLDIVVKECNVENVIVWYEDVKGDSILHPYYWICPFDITSKAHRINEGSVGRVYKNQKAEVYSSYSIGDDECTDNDFKELDIKSMVCVPLSNKYDRLGSLQFINEHHSFTDEEADTLQMLSMMIAIRIDENVKLSKLQEDKNIILSAHNITKSFKNGDVVTNVLKGVNLDVYEGEFVVVLGESGCGKSTFLNIIGGLDSADDGTFEYLGKDMSNASQDELTKYRRDNIGFIFQSYNLMPNLNAKQNLDLISELVKNPLDSKEVLDMVGLNDRQTNYPSELSGGQQQRVSIARSLVKNPHMIFADEPTAALDYETSITVLESLENVTSNGTTLIMVTHNTEIAKMADRVVRFRDGRVYEITRNNHPLKAKDLVW